MEQRIIPLSHTGLFPRLVLDYLSLKEDMKPFYDYAPTMEGLKARLEEVKAAAKDNALIAEVLTEQHGEALSAKQKENLDALRADAAYTICTGHQLCLFGGPAYLMYKIISIISLSDRLSKETGERIVPLFWLASEDHDVDEVDHGFLFNNRIELKTDHQGPAGYIPLDEVEEALTQLEGILGNSDRTVEVMQMMRSAYRSTGNMSIAMRGLLQSLFGERGLLILDADDVRLKQVFAPMMMREMESGITEQAMASAVEMLANRGESVQATARGINLFYMTRESRERIIKNGDQFEVLNSELSWTQSELAEELAKHPEDFSPNVLMRPVYQEFILPNLAYIGGPGELSYWLQLKDVFHAFDLRMPVAVLRDSFLLLDQRTEVKMADLDLSLMDMFRDIDALHKDYATANATEEPNLSENKEVLIKHFDELIARSQLIDPSIAQFAKAERQKLINTVDNMEKKLVRAEKKKHGDALDRISQLKERILPGGGLEERKENFLRYYVPMGDAYFDQLFELSDPLSPGVKVLSF
jgi:bacillithiol biosynthesis cysteine-adding enzyme BshC